ncbi:MAG: hypothetical protein IJ071_02130 [Ruminococcus sp.]|nr:hypothetical protein [Ruminococcus sp.]
MIFNYIALAAAGLFLLLSIVCDIAEKIPPREKLLRRLKTNLREITKLPFVIIALLVLFIGSKVSGADIKLTFGAILVFFVGLVILHWYRLSSVQRSRRLKKKSAPLLPVRKAPINEKTAAEAAEAPLARVLEPMEPAVIEGQLSDTN